MTWRVALIPPALALRDEFLVEVHPIRQDHVSKGLPVHVMTVGLDGNFFSEGDVRGGVLGVVAEGGVAIDDGDDRAGEICRDRGADKQERMQPRL